MARCDFCSDPTTNRVFPPDMIDEPIEAGPHKGKRICHFCKFGTDVLKGSDGTIYKRDEVVADYKKFCEDIYHKPELYIKFNKSLINDAVAKK